MKLKQPVSRLLGALWLLLCLPLSAADRVISLSPHTTEMAYAAGLGDKMVAASLYSDYPPAAEKLEKVASWQGINLERILALKPDLILAWRGGNPQRVLDQLAGFNIPIFYSDPKSIDGIADDLDRLASYSPTPQVAHDAANHFRDEVKMLREKYQRPTATRVLMQFGTQPLFTTSKATIQSDLLSLCGATNIFADSPVPWPQVSREQVIVRKPQVIVVSGSQEQIETVKQFWQPQLNVPVIAINEDWLNRSGPRIILAAQSLCEQLDNLTPKTAQ